MYYCFYTNLYDKIIQSYNFIVKMLHNKYKTIIFAPKNNTIVI